MSFTKSLSEYNFLSELYAKDAPEYTLMAEYPSSNSNKTKFQNTTKYFIHDPFPPPPVELLKTLGPHHLMYGWGDRIPVTSEIQPPEVLLKHWHKEFGEIGVPKWVPYSEDQKCITSFPFETIPRNQQFLDPVILYHLHSKAAIAEIECPQAKVLDKIEFPCVMKLSHGYAGLGNFFINDEHDLVNAQEKIKREWPEAEVIINQKIENIMGDYGVQFYVDREGTVTWIGFTEQIFNKNMRWSGAKFNSSVQDKFYEEFYKFAEAVAEYLYKNKYFGVVGIDLLKDKEGNLFLVDLNPRLTGSTPFLMSARLFAKQGLTHGLYSASIELNGNLEKIINHVEKILDGKVLILSGYEQKNTETTICHISISANKQSECQKILLDLKNINLNSSSS